MPPTNEPSRRYFLGIEGDQLGPFSKQGVIDKIAAGEVPKDAMIWWEGLADWRPIEEMEAFRGHLFLTADDTPAPIAETAVSEEAPPPPQRSLRETLRERSGDSTPPTFSRSEDEMKPVFDRSHFDRGDSLFVLNRNWFIGAGAVFLFLVAGVLQFRINSRSSEILKSKRNIAAANESLEARMRIVTSSASQLFLDPQKNIPVLEKVVSEKADDSAAKEATEALMDYYRQSKKPMEAADLLNRLKRYPEAVKFYLSAPDGNAPAEKALFKAFQNDKDKNRSNYLLQNIQLLLGPLDKREVALQRIRLFEQTFPGQTHPYGYYLLPVDKKIENLFNRISFSFVQSLVAHMASEFPQVNLLNRPLVTVKKTAQGQYRIQGSYSGDILLNQDRVGQINFTFWLLNDQWILADTNLTKERQRQTASIRQKLKINSQTGQQLLDYLENKFRTEFPGIAPHEPVSMESKKSRGPNPND